MVGRFISLKHESDEANGKEVNFTIDRQKILGWSLIFARSTGRKEKFVELQKS
jgi:hypothetical protein